MTRTTRKGHSQAATAVLLAGFLSAAGLGGCSAVTEGGTASAVTPSRSAEIETMLSKMTPRNDIQKVTKAGLVALSEGRYQEAGQAFQAGLRLEPANGNLHFLNALAYHLRGRAGETKMLDLAQAGYMTALKFDESNHMAAYLLGQIHFRKKDYVTAQNYFAYGLFYAPDNVPLLNAMAAASYYSHDPVTAGWASRRAYGLAPGNPASIRNVMFAEAATGEFDDQPRLMQEYEAAARKKIEGADPYLLDLNLERTTSRLKDWKAFHVAANGSIFSTPSSDIVTYSGSSDGSGTGDGDATPSFADEGTSSGGAPAGAASATPAAATPGEKKAALPKMTNIDVVIIRTEEVRSQAMGINLLEGLQTTLTGTLYGYKYDKQTGTAGTSKLIEKTFNPTFDFKDLEYNLNIFNDEWNKAEIIARPSLLATENVTSQFFSGGVLHVQLFSNNYDGGLEDINIGITLSVTPQFIDADTLSVNVQADHEFLEMQDENVGFTAFAQTAKTSVQAKAVLKFGETLMLSGLSERQRDGGKNGVPLLQDVPVVQYLFSRKEEVEAKKSILILLTPVKPRYANDSMSEAEIEDRMDLERFYTDKLKTVEKIKNTNLNAAIAHLGDGSQFYRQFRTGDIELKFFEDDDSIFGAIKRTFGFLYY